MGSIQTRHIATCGLTVRTVTGTITSAELLAAIQSFCAGPATPLLLWDVRAADLSALAADDVRLIARTVSGPAGSRAGGKTALVFASDLGYGLGRMFDSYVDAGGPDVEYRSYRSLPEALTWLGVPADALEALPSAGQ